MGILQRGNGGESSDSTRSTQDDFCLGACRFVSASDDDTMPNLIIVAPETINIDPTRLQRAYALLQRWVDAERIPAAGVCVGRQGRIVQPRFFGKQRPEPGSPPLRDDALFLIASITK